MVVFAGLPTIQVAVPFLQMARSVLITSVTSSRDWAVSDARGLAAAGVGRYAQNSG
jgi:predicted transcriptional regulator